MLSKHHIPPFDLGPLDIDIEQDHQETQFGPSAPSLPSTGSGWCEHVCVEEEVAVDLRLMQDHLDEDDDRVEFNVLVSYPTTTLLP